LRENVEPAVQVLERLGRLRVEATKGVNDLVLSVDGDSGRFLRLFRRAKGEWRRVAPSKDHSWTVATASDGAVEVGIGVVMPQAGPDGLQPIWPRAFDVVVSTKAQPGQRVRVPFRVPPYVIPSALEPVEELMIVSLAVTHDAVQGVRAFAARTGLKLVVYEAQDASDQWMQDTIQPGLFAFPTPFGTEQVRASLTGLRKGSRASAARLDYQVARSLRRLGVVTIAPGIPRDNTRWIDGYGNLEATPPHFDRRGRRFPFGRVLVGKQRELSMHPAVMKFLEAQGVQWPPIVVDTSWLAIGHVDEVVNFVPAKAAAGFKVLLPSPKAARELLDGLLAKGLEEAMVFEGTEDEMTIGELRLTIASTSENLAIDEAVGRVQERLKRELNLEDSDFVMLPALFQRGVAVIPNAVNSMAVNGDLLVAEPRGPLLDGKDVFENAIRAALTECSVRVVFIDAWDAYHTSAGEIHCGTNTFRRLRGPAWWTHVGNEDEKGR
jgi:protein-arginine deiminase